MIELVKNAFPAVAVAADETVAQLQPGEVVIPAQAVLDSLKLRLNRLIEAARLVYADAPSDRTSFELSNLHQWLYQLESLPKWSNWPTALPAFEEGLDKMEAGEQVILQQATREEVEGAKVARDPLEASFNRVLHVLNRLGKDLFRDACEGLDQPDREFQEATIRQWVMDCLHQVELDYNHKWKSYAYCALSISFLGQVKDLIPPDGDVTPESIPPSLSQSLSAWADEIWSHLDDIAELELHMPHAPDMDSFRKATKALSDLARTIGDKANEIYDLAPGTQESPAEATPEPAPDPAPNWRAAVVGWACQLTKICESLNSLDAEDSKYPYDVDRLSDDVNAIARLMLDSSGTD